MDRLYILLFISQFFCFGQQKIDNSEIYSWFDDIVGYESTNIVNGKQYLNVHNSSSLFNHHHPYFISDKALIGNLSYDGNTFYDIKLKYNLYSDELIFESYDDRGIILLDKRKVVEFKVNDAVFENIDSFNNGEVVNGFCELLYNNEDVRLYKKHYKNKKEVAINGGIKYDFIEKNNYVLFRKKFYQINSKKELINVFNENKNVIKAYYKKNKVLKENKPDIFLEGLVAKLVSLKGK